MPLHTFIPGTIRAAVDQIRRDLRTYRDLGRAKRRPVFTSKYTDEELDEISRRAADERQALLSRQSAVDTDLRAVFRNLEVVEVRRPTKTATTLVFDNVPSNPVDFTPGQFLTLIFDLDGEEVRRAYSFCSDPADGARIAVTVKRVKDGRVSNHIADNVKVGDVIRTLGPNGRFGTSPDPRASRRLVLVAGGSGITPLFSVAQALLAREPATTVDLIYANRNKSHVIFHDELAGLESRHEKFTVTHVLERPPKSWDGLRGRLTGETLSDALPIADDAAYYVCGPAPMMDAVCEHLRSRGVDDSRIQTEHFLDQSAPDGAR